MFSERFGRLDIVSEGTVLEFLPELGERVVVENGDGNQISDLRLRHAQHLPGKRGEVGDPQSMVTGPSDDFLLYVIQSHGDGILQIVPANLHDGLYCTSSDSQNQ
jgi:hypothetical protein